MDTSIPKTDFEEWLSGKKYFNPDTMLYFTKDEIVEMCREKGRFVPDDKLEFEDEDFLTEEVLAERGFYSIGMATDEVKKKAIK